ncbi:unnamed protein product, partial [Pleuronectes platessa]
MLMETCYRKDRRWLGQMFPSRDDSPSEPGNPCEGSPLQLGLTVVPNAFTQRGWALTHGTVAYPIRPRQMAAHTESDSERGFFSPQSPSVCSLWELSGCSITLYELNQE